MENTPIPTQLAHKLEREFIPAEKDPATYLDCKFGFKLLLRKPEIFKIS